MTRLDWIIVTVDGSAVGGEVHYSVDLKELF